MMDAVFILNGIKSIFPFNFKWFVLMLCSVLD